MTKLDYTIHSFTMKADVTEDRIRLDAVSADGIYQSIWLTRRLADRFLPHIAREAEKQVKPGLPREIVLSMNQQQLRTERAENPVAPIKSQPAIKPWLCLTVHFKNTPQGLLWTMTDDATIDAHMMLAGDTQRAVLDVFLNTYRKLSWDDQLYPNWLREAGVPAEVEPKQLN